MDTLVKSDLFFFVTTIALVVVSLGMLAVIVYVLYILKEMKALIQLVKNETELIREDMGDLRSHVRTEGFKWSSLFIFFRKLWKHKSLKKKSEDF